MFEVPFGEYDLPDLEAAKSLYADLHEDICAGRIKGAYALDGFGLAPAAARMAFGNGLGVKLEADLDPDKLFAPLFGSIVAEVPASMVKELKAEGRVAGQVLEEKQLCWRDVNISLEEALASWKGTLEKVFRTRSGAAGADRNEPENISAAGSGSVYVCRHKIAKPRVFIPVFPGTNCEYDSAKAFERAGAETDVRVFRNLSSQDIRDSVESFAEAIGKAQIIMFPGGFSAGDEPDGSAKFFATAFRNEKLKEAVMKLLNERDGLALGICNGFQALIKLGLVPYGQIRGQEQDSPTLTFNTIGRHISKMVYTKVVSTRSPWLTLAGEGNVYVSPASHGEGRFVADRKWIERLYANGQVATVYSDPDGNVSMDEEWNINGSFACIEGITSPDGRVFGRMCHAERRGEAVAMNIYGEQDMKIFESGVAYFR